MDVGAYIQAVITVGGGIMGIWGFCKVIMDIKAKNDKEVKWRQKVDDTCKTVEENADKWNKGLSDVYAERGEIVRRFDSKLQEQDEEIDRLKEINVKILKAINVLLEDRVEKGANGDVNKMHHELNDFLAENFGK